jgi:outer membrane protein OmpA-like peptidoglycan-associated protein
LAATLRSLRLHRAGERGDFLAVPETVLKGSSLDLAARTLTLGELSLASGIGLNPLAAKLAATVKGLPLVPLQGYITDRLHLVVNDGTASAAGELTVAAGGPASSASFTGRASVDRLATVDAHAAEDLVKWDSLVFTGVSFASEPFRLEIADVTLAGLASKVILAADGAIAFVDRSVSPEFRMDVTGLAGSVSGLSSLASTAADVDLRATLNGQAPVSLTGRVNMLAGNLFLDIKVAARDLDLPPVSPYSGVYAGYAIQRGKLDVDLAYKIAQGRLEAQNKVELDQFDFGEKVASPKATHLPVRLAISLLKDREGRITLNLPVSGSLDDPKFRVGRIILKMIVNLLAKVATSPFSLLGSLFGGSSAELDTVAFAPGAATLDDTARGRLDILAKALNDRPGLRLEIAGRTDEAADREGLRRIGLERAIRREKLDDLVRKGGTTPSLDAVTVEPAEYDEYLTRAYKHGKFAKPRNFLGIAKKEPAPEMERLPLASLDPSPDALRHLATARAEAVQGYLLQTGKVKADQLFIVGPSGAAPAAKGKGPTTRIDLSLK